MSQPGPSRSPSSPRSGPSSPAKDRSFLNQAVSFQVDDSTSRNQEDYYGYEPYDNRSQFLANEDDLDELMNEQDIQCLKDWIQHVFSKICGYDYYTYELVELITQNEPDTFITIYERPSVIVTGIKKVIRSLRDKFRQFDVGVEEISTLAGSQLGARIQAAAENASKILEETEKENDILRETIKMGAFRREELEAKLNDALSYIQILKNEGIFRGIPKEEEYFLEDLLYRESEKGAKSELDSSFLDDVARLNKALQNAERAKLQAEKEKMDALTELKKDTELGGGIKSALLKKIKTIEADEEICKEAVDEWMKSIEETFEAKYEDIQHIKDIAKSLDDEIEHLKQELQKSTLERNELDYKITVCEEAVQEKFKELVECEDQIAAMKEYIAELRQQYEAFSNEAEKMKQSMSSQNVMDSSYRSPTPSGSPISMDRSGSSYAESMESPRMQHRINSPKYVERASSPISPPSPETPESMSPSAPHVPYIVVSPPPSEYHRDPDFIQNGQLIASEAQPSSDFSGTVAPVNLSTQSLVRNRFDIGQNFNMRTVHSGTPSPYHQVTRLESYQPAEGTSRMIDSPMRIQHTASHITPDLVTPFVSTTRYGYTDPTAKCLNLPPGDDLDIGSSLRKTLLLTSPRRENPLIVNIDVQPQPLTRTADGEKFVCDISLNLQERSEPPIEPTYTYGVPPAVTPTTTRRHGQFTPKSIFKKRHYNIRRLYGSQYESPDMPSKWSPHYLPFDSRSPVTSFPPSPYYSDRSISWERSYDNTFDESRMNTTYDPQSGKFEGPSPAKVHKKFDEYVSPIIKGPRRRYPTPVFSDERYDVDTSSPVIKGPSYRSNMYRHSPLSESPLTESDKSFDSPSPVIKGRYYTPHSPIHNRTFDSSQSSPRRDFDRSSTRDSFLDSRESSGSDGSYGRSSTRDSFLDSRTPPRLDGSSFSPRSDKSFNQSLSLPRKGGAVDRTFSPRSDKSFNQSLSPKQYRKFDRTFSPRSDKSFNQSLSPPRKGGAVDRTFSPRSDKSFNQSLSPPRQGGAFDRSFSPRSDKSFNQSMSPTRSPHQSAYTAHNETHSSGANETFGNISPQESDSSDKNNIRDGSIQNLKGPKQDDSN